VAHHAQGRVIAAFSRRFIVETPEGPLPCQVKGRHLRVVCGDRVVFHSDGKSGVIEDILPRTNLFHRSDAFRSKPIAANVTQIAVVMAARPSFSLELTQRCILAAEAAGVASLLVLNKTDLPETSLAHERLGMLTRLGYPLVELCAHRDVAPLLPALQGHTTLLIGQSGMGKSTIINALVPEAAADTAEFSEALDSGRHTTTHTRLYQIAPYTALIDSPGLQEFALQHVDADALAHAFIEFRPYLGQCRFRDCQHQHEPGCRIIEAVEAGTIEPKRLQLFQMLQKSRQKSPHHI
jgi:ribosome biogenesis GTPase / thiamine phosphate phosphatase